MYTYIHIYIYTYIYIYICMYIIYICIRMYTYIYTYTSYYINILSQKTQHRPKDCHPLNGLRLGTSAIASERDIRWKVIRFKRWLVPF